VFTGKRRPDGVKIKYQQEIFRIKHSSSKNRPSSYFRPMKSCYWQIIKENTTTDYNLKGFLGSSSQFISTLLKQSELYIKNKYD